ncbi:MAG: catalase [Anaerolineales bacterium]|nr:catalase [Anaerolineales bacterium]
MTWIFNGSLDTGAHSTSHPRKIQDFHCRDMFEAISAGNFPEWEFAVQFFT